MSQHASENSRWPDERNTGADSVRRTEPLLHLNQTHCMRHPSDDVTDDALFGNSSKAEAALFQADIALLPKNNMVEQLDLQRFASAA